MTLNSYEEILINIGTIINEEVCKYDRATKKKIQRDFRKNRRD